MSIAQEFLRAGAGIATAAICFATLPASADIISDWNEQLVAVLLAEKANALAQSRAAAIVQTAVFEAVNSIEQRYAPYNQSIAGAAGASAEAAAASAAYRALVALYPNQRGPARRGDRALAGSCCAQTGQ